MSQGHSLSHSMGQAGGGYSRVLALALAWHPLPSEAWGNSQGCRNYPCV